LTQEEQDALMPKEVVVENPWIYEQTHQEYLENIKVSSNLILFLILDYLKIGSSSETCQCDQKAS